MAVQSAWIDQRCLQASIDPSCLVSHRAGLRPGNIYEESSIRVATSHCDQKEEPKIREPYQDALPPRQVCNQDQKASSYSVGLSYHADVAEIALIANCFGQVAETFSGTFVKPMQGPHLAFKCTCAAFYRYSGVASTCIGQHTVCKSACDLAPGF